MVVGKEKKRKDCRLYIKSIKHVYKESKKSLTSNAERVFYKLDEIGNNANIGIRFFTTWKQKSPVTKCYPKSEYNHWPRFLSPTCSSFLPTLRL